MKLIILALITIVMPSVTFAQQTIISPSTTFGIESSKLLNAEPLIVYEHSREIFRLGKNGCLLGPITIFGSGEKGKMILFSLSEGVWYPNDCNK